MLPSSTLPSPTIFHSSVEMSFHRGSYRGFDRGRGSWHDSASLSRPSHRAEPPPNLKPLGPTIDSIKIKTLLTEDDAPTIKGVEYVASYNWTDDKSPVILVPGEPLSQSPITT
jgi:hypothetical protein